MPLNPFIGVWQRQSIQFDPEPPETHQPVLWIQAETHFADVRRAPFAGRLTPDRYRCMDWRQRFDADLLAFAGTFTWTPTDTHQGTCTWHHDLAITPRYRPDRSRYQWISADDFLEQGTCQDDNGKLHPFTEHWQRVHPGPVQIWDLAAEHGRGKILMAGAWAIVLQDGPPLQTHPLPHADTLGQFAAAAWQQVDDTWQLLFSTATCLGNLPLWTPEDGPGSS